MALSAPLSSSSGPSPVIMLPSTPQALEALKHMDRLRWGCNISMIASLVMLAVTVVFIGLACGRIMLPLNAIYAFSACIGAILITVVLDQILRAIGRRAGIDPQDYFRDRQPPPVKPKKDKP